MYVQTLKSHMCLSNSKSYERDSQGLKELIGDKPSLGTQRKLSGESEASDTPPQRLSRRDRVDRSWGSRENAFQSVGTAFTKALNQQDI